MDILAYVLRSGGSGDSLMYCCLIRASMVDDEMEKAFQQKMKLRKDEAEKCQEDEQE